MTTPLPGIPSSERRIDQRECATSGCAWEGQRWDALTSNSGDRCPECREKGRSTGVKVHVADGERFLSRHARVVDAVSSGGDLG